MTCWCLSSLRFVVLTVCHLLLPCCFLSTSKIKMVIISNTPLTECLVLHCACVKGSKNLCFDRILFAKHLLLTGFPCRVDSFWFVLLSTYTWEISVLQKCVSLWSKEVRRTQEEQEALICHDATSSLAKWKIVLDQHEVDTGDKKVWNENINTY